MLLWLRPAVVLSTLWVAVVLFFPFHIFIIYIHNIRYVVCGHSVQMFISLGVVFDESELHVWGKSVDP